MYKHASRLPQRGSKFAPSLLPFFLQNKRIDLYTTCAAGRGQLQSPRFAA
jgi:hypothetical protein